MSCTRPHSGRPSPIAIAVRLGLDQRPATTPQRARKAEQTRALRSTRSKQHANHSAHESHTLSHRAVEAVLSATDHSSPDITSASASSSAKSTAAADSAFLSALSGWKLANHELDSIAEQIASESSQLDERTLLADEISRLDATAVMQRMIGSMLSPISVEQATAETEAKIRRISDGEADQETAEAGKQRREQLQIMKQRLPHIPDAIYEL